MKKGSNQSIVKSIGFALIGIGGLVGAVTGNFRIATAILAIGGGVLAVAEFL